jgi:hypothetical protein
LAVTSSVAVGGCARTVEGAAERAVPAAAAQGRGFGYVDNRCGMLADSSVQDTLGAQDVVRPYSGAVCQYILDRRSSIVDATFSWFDSGSLDRERAVAVDRGARVSDIVVQRRPTLLARQTITGAGCSATTTADVGGSHGSGGVLSWWVQVRAQPGQSAQPGADPCADAKKLLAATLSSEM